MVQIETARKMTKEEAREVTSVIMNSRQLTQTPDKKIKDIFKFIPCAGAFTFIAFLSFLIFLILDSGDLMACFGLGISVLAIFIEIFFTRTCLKYYHTMLDRDAKVTITLDENGVLYDEHGAEKIQLSWSRISAIRLFKYSVYMFPKEITGIMVCMPASEADKIREFLAETPVQVRTIDL
ncbi:MAG: hypothetical protein J5546_02055 [Lachnospiraceae bacterium]|nr:hypothetical protein [Lachnospiraceae bacterium]